MAFIVQVSNIKLDNEGRIYTADASVAKDIIKKFDIAERKDGSVFITEHSRGKARWFGMNRRNGLNPLSMRGMALANDMFILYKSRAELDAFMATLPPSLLN